MGAIEFVEAEQYIQEKRKDAAQRCIEQTED